jgi:hypothetical protein
MLNQLVWIMLWYAEPMFVNHGVLCYASGCESWCAMLRLWSCTHHNSQPLANHISSWLTKLAKNNKQWFTITSSGPLAQQNTPYFKITDSAQHHVLQTDEIWLASGCELWWVMLSQWVWIIMCYAERIVVNHVVLCWTSGCESWSVMLSQWSWIMFCYVESVVVNHVVLCLAIGCESCCVMLGHWLWIMLCYTDPVVVNNCEFCWDSGCESWCAMNNKCVWIMLCYFEPIVLNHDVISWTNWCQHSTMF